MGGTTLLLYKQVGRFSFLSFILFSCFFEWAGETNVSISKDYVSDKDIFWRSINKQMVLNLLAYFYLDSLSIFREWANSIGGYALSYYYMLLWTEFKHLFGSKLALVAYTVSNLNLLKYYLLGWWKLLYLKCTILVQIQSLIWAFNKTAYQVLLPSPNLFKQLMLCWVLNPWLDTKFS